MSLNHLSRRNAISEEPTPRIEDSVRPTDRADRAGSLYAEGVSVDHRKNHGLYLTPVAVADFMAAHVTVGGEVLRVLDPAAGGGILLCALVESVVHRAKNLRRIELVAYEVDATLGTILRGVLAELQTWAAACGVAVTFQVICRDFVLEHAAALRSMSGFLPHLKDGQAFDVVIANPPYFKLNKADPRAQAAASVVHGQPNIYGLFMAVGAALLRDGGELVFITPRSFASGSYFRMFRERFFECIRPQLVHVFGSRRDAFSRDSVLQENVILKGVRDDGWNSAGSAERMIVSSSRGVGDLATSERHSVSLRTVLDLSSHEKVLRLPLTEAEHALVGLLDTWPGSLHAFGLQISTGPVVPFRALPLIDRTGKVPGSHVPLLWMNHVRAMQVTWPIGRHKPEYIKHSPDAKPLLVPNRNYVLLRRFSAKEEERRLVAGPYLACASPASLIGLENHLNYVYRPGGTLTEDETYGLAALFNSSLLDTYFRTINGNTQVGATELRTMPLPAHEVIRAIGREAKTLEGDRDRIDALVLELTEVSSERQKAMARG